MATEYEFWGERFTEPDWEDEWRDISYECEFVDIPAEYKVDFENSDWIDDFDYKTGWEKWSPTDEYWHGDYDERLVDADTIWENIRDALADEVGELPDGTYIISADVDFTIAVNDLYIGIADYNRDEIYPDNMETEFSDIKITNIKIERL